MVDFITQFRTAGGNAANDTIINNEDVVKYQKVNGTHELTGQQAGAAYNNE